MFITHRSRRQSWLKKGIGFEGGENWPPKEKPEISPEALANEGPSGENPSERPFAGKKSQKGEIRNDKTELEEATGLTPTSEMIRNQIQKIEVPGKILLCWERAFPDLPTGM